MKLEPGCRIIIETCHPNGVRNYIKWDDGEERYYDETKLIHRTDSPAIISPNHWDKEYYIHGKRIYVSSDEEFIIKMLLE